MTLRFWLIRKILPSLSRWERDVLLDEMLPWNNRDALDFAAEICGYEDFEQMEDHIARRVSRD